MKGVALGTGRDVAWGIILVTCLATGVGVLGGVAWRDAYAEESAAELQARIATGRRELADIEQEIARYEAQLNEVGAEKQTLQKAIRELDLSRKKVQADIQATEQKISTTDLEITELEREIAIKDLEIARDRDAIAASLRTLDQLERDTPVELVLGYRTFADLWDDIASYEQLRESFRDDVRSLTALKAEYQRTKDRTNEKRAILGSLHHELSGQQATLDQTRSHKNNLLGTTKNKEAGYQQLLAEKRRAHAQFESDIAQLEQALQVILDPTAFPAKGSKVLTWPVASPVVTQGFGLTDFARTGAYGYENGQPKPHRAIDLRAAIGTPILAALGGTVRGAFDMDSIPGCRSYGQWILVEHQNGLSTLYTHLSSMLVGAGDTVTTGQVIGYSGNTGFSEAPHLHFGVFASQGVEVQKFTTSIGCKNALVPIAAPNAYLNPLDYL